MSLVVLATGRSVSTALRRITSPVCGWRRIACGATTAGGDAPAAAGASRTTAAATSAARSRRRVTAGA